MPANSSQATLEIRLPDGFQFLGEVQSLQYRPGDVIVVSTPAVMTKSQRDTVAQVVSGALPGCGVLVLDGGLQVGVLRQEDVISGPN